MITDVMNPRLSLLATFAFTLLCPAQRTSAPTEPPSLLSAALAVPQDPSPAPAQAAALPVGILPAAATENLLPAAILFKGQLAPVQARNSGAIRHSDGTMTIVALVDSSGYSSSVRDRFQFFLYTETPLQLATGKVLPSGFYGGGFLADNTMVVLNVASRDIMIVPTAPDPSLARPRPLQLLPDASGNTRLYLGRSYIVLRATP